MQQWMGWLVSVLGHPVELISILSDLIHILPRRCIHTHTYAGVHITKSLKQTTGTMYCWMVKCCFLAIVFLTISTVNSWDLFLRAFLFQFSLLCMQRLMTHFCLHIFSCCMHIFQHLHRNTLQALKCK